jgi:hypothetical protein
MDPSGSLFPMAVLLLGIAGVALFMAGRPWPAPDGQPVKPGAYAVQILQGKTPAASQAPDRNAEISTIQAGLTTILAIWAASKLAGVLQGIGGGGGGGGGEGEGDGGNEADTIGDDIASDAGDVLG